MDPRLRGDDDKESGDDDKESGDDDKKNCPKPSNAIALKA
jgi:hypothetical protein